MNLFGSLIFSTCLTCVLLVGVAVNGLADTSSVAVTEAMTEARAISLAEKFGVDVGEVDEEIKDILGLTKAEGVVVFAVIGGSPADLSGIKVKAVIKEIDKHEIKTLIDLGTALEDALQTQNFTVATYEPADPDNQGVAGGLNFHFVRVEKD
jgi:C-terminal processing protease CtpA/Prc